MEPYGLALATFAFLLGGILKGAVGAGSPVLAVPILSMLYGVPFAVSVFVLPNLVSNLWQGWQYRAHLVSRKFAIVFALSGAAGAVLGSVLLSVLPADLLMRIVAFIVLGYVVFRVTRPAWRMSDGLANRLVAAAGFVGGVLQGAGGISAPVSVTFLNAMKLERAAFIATISIFFVAMSVVQVPTLIGLGILTQDRLLFSVFAMAPLLGGMPIGAWIARRVQADVFDKLVLALLLVVALKLIFWPNT